MQFKSYALFVLLFLEVVAYAQTTVFTYQGRLTDAGAPANETFDLRFTLHETAVLTNQIGSATNVAPVTVSNGLFTVSLDFGNVFDGGARWLQIGVRAFGDLNPYAVLAPRQLLTSTPYAIQAISAGTASNLSGTLPATSLVGTVPDAQLSANVALLNGAANFSGNVSAPFVSGNGTGLTNVPGRIFEVIPTASNIQALPNTGYLATNDNTAVVVTLPASIRVGETVRVSASGAGGWILAQNAGQSILYGNLLSNIGDSWTPRESSRNWKAIASSSDGSKLVAVVNGGHIFTSTNYGVAWTDRATLGNQNWTSVASSGDGNKLLAAASSGLYTSTNSGATWTLRQGPSSWTGVASSLDGQKLVAVAGAGITTSTNGGVAWTPRLLTPNWSAVASSANGSNLVAAVQNGLIYTSTNSGISWVSRENNRNWISVASSSDGTRLVAAAFGDLLYTSSNSGTNWTANLVAQNWTSVASSADGARLAAAGDGIVFISTDSGMAWLPRDTLPVFGWQAIASSGDGSTLAVAGANTVIYVSSTATTTPGTAGYLSGARLSAVEVVYCGNGVFMPITSMGTLRAR
jgi:hypothetical protein